MEAVVRGQEDVAGIDAVPMQHSHGGCYRKLLWAMACVLPKSRWLVILHFPKFTSGILAITLGIILPQGFVRDRDSLWTHLACQVAPHIDDLRFLQLVLLPLGVSFLVQLWGPAWAASIEHFNGMTACRLRVGIVAASFNSMLLAWLIIVEVLQLCQRPHAIRSPCNDVISFGGFGLFDMILFLSNFELVALVCSIIMAGIGCVVSQISLICCLPCLVWFIPKPVKKREVSELIEAFAYVATEELPGECAVCLVTFEEGVQCARLPCNKLHIFHEDCAEAWLSTSRRCPLCRCNLDGLLDEQEAVIEAHDGVDGAQENVIEAHDSADEAHDDLEAPHPRAGSESAGSNPLKMSL